MPLTWSRPPFTISDDRERIDLDLVHDVLTSSYWARGIERALVERSIRHSMALGLYEGTSQIGFARVVSDRATFAWLGDVFVLPESRGQGLGAWLVETALAHPELAGIRRWHLVTRDAQGLYRPLGFAEVARPDMHLERLLANVRPKDPPGQSAGPPQPES